MVQDNNNGHNGTNGFSSQNNDEENVIRFPPGGKKPDKIVGAAPANASKPPMINLPPLTRALIFVLLGIHGLVWVSGFIDPAYPDMVTMMGAFTPGSWNGTSPYVWWTPFTLITFTFLHGGWIHLIINILMLMAFGTGVEKWLGAKRYLILFFGSTLAAVLTQFVADPSSPAGIVGASGGISGFFGALLLMLQQQRALGNQKNSILPFIVIWLVITVVFGFMGAPDGSPIAWLAHIGGFFGGLGIAWLMLKKSGGRSV